MAIVDEHGDSPPVHTSRTDVSEDLYMVHGIMPTKFEAKPPRPQTSRFYHEGQMGAGAHPPATESSAFDRILADQIAEEEGDDADEDTSASRSGSAT